MSNSELLTIRETAELLKVHINTVRFWVKVGLLKGYKIGSVIRLKKRQVFKALKEEATNERNESKK